MSYVLRIEDANSETPVVLAAGSLGLVAYAAREGIAAIKDSESEFSAIIAETAEVGGEEKRTVVRVTGDADVVAVVVKKKLSRERAANAPESEDETAAAE